MDITKELEDLKGEFFTTDLKRQQLREGFTTGSLIRAFDLWRSKSEWYLHKTLIEDCALRGGCCGRTCGCCRNRKLPPTRQSATGHCTVECLCCQNSRGFALSEQAKINMRETFSLELDETRNCQYYEKIMLASIFGIAIDSTKNPFHLIDMPPAYTSTSTTSMRIPSREETESSEETSAGGI